MKSWRTARVFLPTRYEAREVVLRLLLLPFAFGPAALRRAAATALTSLLMRRRGYRTYAVARVPEALAAHAGMAREEFARGLEVRMRWESALLWRGVAFHRWKRRIRLHGLAHVTSALREGRGVILWVHPCVSSNVAVKQALCEAGYPLVHLSRPGHPFSGRPFGCRFINPVLRRAEVPFLAERVLIDDERTVAAVRRLRSVLAAGGVVSITVTANATSVGEDPFLGGTLRLPFGPVQLAASTGADLLPVFTSGTPERPLVEIGAPLPVGRAAETVRDCHLAALQWLERRLMAEPLAWTGWRGGGFVRRRATEPAPPALPATPGSP